MTSSKSTKRALISSALAILMCVAMLIGTTFAWFTDTASTAVNKIQSGKLDVALEMSTDGVNWESAEGQTLTFKTQDNRAADKILWEPGCTYELPQLRVVNNGNLALKYKITVNGVTGDAKLLEAIDFTAKMGTTEIALDSLKGAILPSGAAPTPAGEAVGATEPITIKGVMKTTAGNEYQGLSIDGIGITVVATQYTYEYDSKDNLYDKDADATIQVNKDNIQDYLDGKYGSIDGMTLVLAEGEYGTLELGRATKYPGSNTKTYLLTSAALTEHTIDQIKAEIDAHPGGGAGTPYYVRTMNNVTMKAAEGAAVTIDGIKMNSAQIAGANGNVEYDYVLEREVPDSNKSFKVIYDANNLCFEGLTFTKIVNIENLLEETSINGVSFKNCKFNINNTENVLENYGIRFYSEFNNGRLKNLVVDNCKFNGCRLAVYSHHIYNVSVTNSYFDTTGHNAIAVQAHGGKICNHGKVVITNNVFNNIGDRIIRFNNVGADTQITIKGNTATNSGDTAGEVIKATSLADGIKYDISGNNWGIDKTVANTEFADK